MFEQGLAARKIQLARDIVFEVEDVDPAPEFFVDLTFIKTAKDRPSQDARDHQEMRDRIAVEIKRATAILFEIEDLSTMVESRLNQIRAFEKSDRLAKLAQIPLERGCDPNALKLEEPGHVLHALHQTLAQ